jgi:hypothetical protein
MVCAAAVVPALARAADDRVLRHYPIHYDGPLVHNPLGAGVPDVTGGLPKFDVTYHGGPVQTTTKTYTIFWRPSGTYMSPNYQTLIDRFLGDVGGSAIYGMATTYYGYNGRVNNKSAFGGAYVDQTPYPLGRITDHDLQAEVIKSALAMKWKPGLESQFFIFTAKGALKGVNYCAYHSAFVYGSPPGKPYVYGFIPYVGYLNGCDPPYGISPNNDVDSDGSILSLSHEQMEMVTDPLIDAWFDSKNGLEVGDICIFSFGVPIARSGANLVIGSDPYFLQEDYSQTGHSCLPNL